MERENGKVISNRRSILCVFRFLFCLESKSYLLVKMERYRNKQAHLIAR